MGLFDKIKEPVILKEDSSAKEQLKEMELLLPSMLDAKNRSLLENDIAAVNNHNTDMIFRCYVQTKINLAHALAYSCTSIKELLKNAPDAHREARKDLQHCDGALFTVTVNGKEKCIIHYVTTGGPKFYEYMGQGMYYSRALGPKTFEKYTKIALERGATLQEALDHQMEFNKKHNPQFFK